MSRQTPTPSPMSPEQALAELLEWSDSGTQRVAELTGPHGSGRTETLLRLSEARGEAVDVLVVERRDEDGVQPAHDLVGHLVALVLQVSHARGLRGRIVEPVDQLEEQGVVGPSQGGGKERDVLLGPLDEDEADSVL